MSKKTATAINRRAFFGRAGVGAGAVGAAAVGLSISTGKAASPAKRRVKGAGYQETDHVRTFYKLARF